MDTITEVPTYQATIYCGLRPSGSEVNKRPWKAEQICREFAENVGLCVSFTLTRFIYDTGEEPGFIVGLINYPRSPKDPNDIRTHAITLAETLKDAYQQERVTVVCTDKTFMLGEIE